MALVSCTECGKQVSDKASSCPNCGAPIVSGSASAPAPPAAKASSSVSVRRIATLLGLGFILIVGYLWFRRAGSDPASRGILPRAIVPSPHFLLTTAGGSDECSVFGEYCMRAKCAVANDGNAAGVASVDISLILDGSPVATRRSLVSLAPGQSDTARQDFNEAEMSKTYSYQCELVK